MSKHPHTTLDSVISSLCNLHSYLCKAASHPQEISEHYAKPPSCVWSLLLHEILI